LPVLPKTLSADTSPEVARRQVEGWRQMSAEQKAALVFGLTHAAYELARAGIRQRYPNATRRDQLRRLAIVTLGPDLALQAAFDVDRDGSAVTSPVDPIAVALAVVRVFNTLGIAHTIGGSIASSFAGEPRSTVDIDVVAAIGESQVPAFVAALSRDFYVDDASIRRAIRERASANLIHYATQLKVDIFVAGGTPLDDQQLMRRQEVTLGPGRTLHVHPPEDILLQKLLWFQRGGEKSDRQWRDILGIIRVQGLHLDRDYLAINAPKLGVADLLARALDES
jgi:hypothetical protein